MGAVYSFPHAGNSYTTALYATARRMGLDVREIDFSGRAILRNLGRGDTLHLHWPSFHYYDPASRGRTFYGLLRFVLIYSLLKLRGVRIVWTAHNLYPHDGAKHEWMHRVARRFVVRISQRIFVHGPTAAAIVSDEFGVPAQKLRVVPHGNWIGSYPNTVGRAEARSRLGLPADAHVFLFIGLCKPYKGLEALIDAMRGLPAGAVLVIAGHFPFPAYQEEILARARAAGSDVVRVRPGWIVESDLQVYLNAANEVVLPYREILTSGAAMLAMSFGRPVIAPRLGSLVDLVGEGCGILFDSQDAGALPGALRTALARQFDSETILAAARACKWEETAGALAEAHRSPARSVGAEAVVQRGGDERAPP